ncbi:MAG: hypothetical protein ABJO86_14350 [Lentilitoribacter sp.]
MNISKKHYLFFEFLQISPSYQGVLLDEPLGKLHPNIAFQNDLPVVESVVSDFGNVWTMKFDEWWQRRGLPAFSATIKAKSRVLHRTSQSPLNNPEEMDAYDFRETEMAVENTRDYYWTTRPEEYSPDIILVAVPIRGNKRDVVKDITDLVKQEYDRVKPPKLVHKYKFNTDSNVRTRTLDKYLQTVKLRALHPQIPLHELGVIAAKYYREKGSTKLHGRDQQNMAVQTSTRLALARNVAENAARGKFASSQKLDIDISTTKKRTDESGSFLGLETIEYPMPKFNFALIRELILKGEISKPKIDIQKFM